MTTQPARILIVEDNPTNMKLARDILEAKGYEVIPTETAEAGLEAAAKDAPDLVLMDIQLPGMNGIDALLELRGSDTTASTPVIAFTASVTESDRCRVSQAGFDAFISKPIELKNFLRTIETVLDSNQVASA